MTRYHVRVKKHQIIALVILVVFLLFGGAYYLYSSKKNYDIIHPTIGDLTEAVYGLGKVKSHKRFEVVLGVMTTVQKLYTDEGVEVKAGDPIIQFESGIVRAPFNGTITYVRLREGETALPQVPIIRLEDISDRYIELTLEQQAALRIEKGQTARVSLESFRSKYLPGKVAAIFPREDEFVAHIAVDGLDKNVLPGMTADVSVEIGKIKNALLVPVKAIHNGMITVKKGSRWVNKNVDVGHVDGRNVEILHSDLKTTDEIRLKKDD